MMPGVEPIKQQAKKADYLKKNLGEGSRKGTGFATVREACTEAQINQIDGTGEQDTNSFLL